MSETDPDARSEPRQLPPLPARSAPVVIQADTPTGKGAGTPAPTAAPTGAPPVAPEEATGRRSPWPLVVGLVLVAAVACLAVIRISSDDEDRDEDSGPGAEQASSPAASDSTSSSDAGGIGDETEEVSPTAGLSPSELAVAFVEALIDDSEELDGLADDSILDEARSDPEYPAFLGFAGAEISADSECALGDVTQSCLVYLNDPTGGAMAVAVGISVFGTDIVYDPSTGAVTNPDGTPATAVPPRIVSVDLITS